MHPLISKLEQIGSRARSMVRFHAAAAVLAVAVGGLLLIGIADYLVDVFLRGGEFGNTEDSGLRWIALLVWLVATVGAVWVWWLPAWRWNPSPREIAAKLEKLYPKLDGRLISGVDFLDRDEHQADSSQLSRRVVAEATDDLEQLPWRESLSFRKLWPAINIAGVSFLVALALFAITPKLASLAVMRTAAPWAELPWPRRNDLELENLPAKIARGTDLEIRVVDRNKRLPDITLEYQTVAEDGSLGDVGRRDMQALPTFAITTLPSITQNLLVRASGGDDQTPWQPIEVVDPPQVTSLSVKVQPPDYTGWQGLSSDGSFRALAGSTATFQAKANRQIVAANLKVRSDKGLQDLELTVAADGMTASLVEPLRLTNSAEYVIELIDVDNIAGISTPEQIAITPDAPPNVDWKSPANNEQSLATAVLPVELVADDDLAIAKVELKYTRSDRSGDAPQLIVLYERPETTTKIAMADALALARDTVKIEYAWNLAETFGPESPLKSPLPTGTVLGLHIVATDNKGVVTETPLRRLSILDDDEFRDAIARQQNDLLAAIAEALEKQRDSLSGVVGLQSELEVASRPESNAVLDGLPQKLQRAELLQRKVTELLSEDSGGVAAKIVALEQRLATNGEDDDTLKTQLRELYQAVIELGRGKSPAAQRELLMGLRVAREEEDATEKLLPHVRTAADEQREIVNKLEELLGDMRRWDHYRRWARELAALKNAERRLAEEADALRLELLSQASPQPTARQEATLKGISSRQAELTRQYDAIIAGMQEMATDLANPMNQDDPASQDPVARQTLTDAIARARELGIGSQLREARRSLEGGRVSEGVSQQQSAAAALEEVIDTLSNRKEYRLDRLLRKLNEAKDQLNELRNAEKELRKAQDAAANQADAAEKERQLEKLRREKEALAEKAKQLARQLERLTAEQAADAVQRAADQLEAASSGGDDSNDAGPTEQETEELLEEADEALDDAEEKLDDAIDKVKEQLFNEQMQKLQQQVQGLANRQQSLHGETQRLVDLAAGEGLSPEQLETLAGVITAQASLADDTLGLAETLAGAAAFQLALAEAASEMKSAAGALERSDLSALPLGKQQDAVKRLEEIVAALESMQPGGNEEGPPGPNEPPGDPGDSNGVDNIAQLKLLRGMEARILTRTEEIQKQRLALGGLTPQLMEEVRTLADRQKAISDTIEEMISGAGGGAGPQNADPDADAEESLPSLEELLQ